MTRKSRLFRILPGLVALGILFAVVMALSFANKLARTGSGYMAKVMCSEVFVANRNEREVRQVEFNAIHPLMKKLSVKVDRSRNRVRVSLYGLGRADAYFSDDTGCSLAPVHGQFTGHEDIPDQLITPQPWATAFSDQDNRIANIDYNALARALEDASKDRDAGHRALIVAVDGQLVAEWYADGFTAETPLLSWSAAKSVTATLIGIGVQQNQLSVYDPLPVPEWQEDPKRAALTWDDLLRMHSGLEFDEDYTDTSSDVNRMLFSARSVAQIAAAQPLNNKPGQKWYYSSGTSNILARAIGDIAERQDGSLARFTRDHFLTPLGLTHTTLEVDAAGDFIGSSYVYATARDWTKMGQLYLQNGVWNGKQILPKEWTDYVSRPTPASDDQYGAHFWLNRPGQLNDATHTQSTTQRSVFFPGLPENAYFFAGRDGQYVVILPDQNMVITRFGLTRSENAATRVAPTLAALFESVNR